jgi:hypothetical protein
VANASHSKLATDAVDIAEQVQIVQVYALWTERVDSGKHPWLWEVELDRAELVTELCDKYVNEVSDRQLLDDCS